MRDLIESLMRDLLSPLSGIIDVCHCDACQMESLEVPIRGKACEAFDANIDDLPLGCLIDLVILTCVLTWETFHI